MLYGFLGGYLESEEYHMVFYRTDKGVLGAPVRGETAESSAILFYRNGLSHKVFPCIEKRVTESYSSVK